jgi:hypothetical protein
MLSKRMEKMRKKIGFILRGALVALCLLFPVMSGAVEGAENPCIVISQEVYDFGTVPEGARVAHEFTIENRGDESLSLQKAVSSCSCLTINSYDELVPLGKTGTVSVSFDSAGYGGQNVVRKVTIQTDDPDTPQLILSVSGRVDKTYTISPEIVKLTCREGEGSCAKVTIYPEEKYAFNVLGVRMKKGEYIECSIEEIENDGRKGCCLTVQSTRKEKGVFFDKVFVDTDSAVVPEISIGVFGKIEEG